LNNGTFPGTSLLNCKKLASDIRTCQAKGKLVTLSLGGAAGNVSFSGDGQAKDFADTIWDLFLGGSSDTRPFGSAVLDGWVYGVWTFRGFLTNRWQDRLGY
jgi:chitinase